MKCTSSNEGYWRAEGNGVLLVNNDCLILEWNDHWMIKRFSPECRKEFVTTLRDRRPFVFQLVIVIGPSEVQFRLQSINLSCSHSFARASRRLRASTLSFDWFNKLSASFVLEHSENFNFGFMILDWKPLSLINYNSLSKVRIHDHYINWSSKVFL